MLYVHNLCANVTSFFKDHDLKIILYQQPDYQHAKTYMENVLIYQGFLAGNHIYLNDNEVMKPENNWLPHELKCQAAQVVSCINKHRHSKT